MTTSVFFGPLHSPISSSPRIISEIRKVHSHSRQLHYAKQHSPTIGSIQNFLSEPRIAGELLVHVPVNEESDEKKLLHGIWSRKLLIIRSGSLEISYQPNTYRIPLRQLHLVSSDLHKNTFVLKRHDASILILIQTVDKKQFEIWVKVIAIELIRQTPLNRVKFFDILTFDTLRENHTSSSTIDYHNSSFKQPHINIDTTPITKPKTSTPKFEFQSLKREHRPNDTANNALFREKILFFESLSRLGRLVHSSEDLSHHPTTIRSRNVSCCSSVQEFVPCATSSPNTSSNICNNDSNRQSIHLQTSIIVKQMCQLFENKNHCKYSCNFNYNNKKHFLQFYHDVNNNKI